MNGYECGKCNCSPCKCEEIKRRKRIVEGKEIAEIGIDVFSKVKRRRMKLIKWLWPDIKRLADALFDYWDKTPTEA